jgi:hypothetical protein
MSRFLLLVSFLAILLLSATSGSLFASDTSDKDRADQYKVSNMKAFDSLVNVPAAAHKYSSSKKKSKVKSTSSRSKGKKVASAKSSKQKKAAHKKAKSYKKAGHHKTKSQKKS